MTDRPLLLPLLLLPLLILCVCATVCVCVAMCGGGVASEVRRHARASLAGVC